MSDQNAPIGPTQPSRDNQSEGITKQQAPNQHISGPSNNSNGWEKGQTRQDVDGVEYQIKRELGRGGFGITYLAIEIAKGKEVVIKILQDELRKDRKFESIENSFINEALQLSRCQSRYIVEVEKVTKIDEKRAIIMDYIAGETLTDKVNSNGVLPVSIALKYIRQIGEALKTVHNQTLLHRDIKPDNIIIRKSTDEAVLIDFGLAFKFDPNNVQFNPGWLTPGYAPIEQYQNNVIWGVYTDVYALAATLYYILTNEVPTAAVDRANGTAFNAPTTFNSKISSQLSQAIMKGLTLGPSDRPKTVQAWLDLLPDSPRTLVILKFKIAALLGLISILGLLGFFIPRKFICNQFIVPLLCESQSQWENYTSPKEYEFKLQYPPNWTVEELPKDALRPWQLQLYTPDKKDEPVMVIFIEEFKDLYSLDKYWQDIVKPRIKNGFKKVTFATNNPEPINLKKQHPAYKLIYTHDQDGELINRTEIITVYNFRGYNIAFTGNDLDYGSYEAAALKVIDSLQFTNP